MVEVPSILGEVFIDTGGVVGVLILVILVVVLVLLIKKL